jgi:hypothetical protein
MFGEWQRTLYLEGNILFRKITPERKLNCCTGHGAPETIVYGTSHTLEAVRQRTERISNPTFGQVASIAKVENFGGSNLMVLTLRRFDPSGCLPRQAVARFVITSGCSYFL